MGHRQAAIDGLHWRSHIRRPINAADFDMPLSLYDASIPPFIRALRNMAFHLDRGRAHADEKGIPHEELTGARLIADMHPLTAQVQRASDTAKFVAARVGGLTAPAMADTEQTFDELQARIKATIDFLETVPADAFDGKEDNEVVLKFGPRSLTFTARDYVQKFALPNFYFHATTAYAILRHKGVPLGKIDFIAGGNV
jgi:hypothetical protein